MGAVMLLENNVMTATDVRLVVFNTAAHATLENPLCFGHGAVQDALKGFKGRKKLVNVPRDRCSNAARKRRAVVHAAAYATHGSRHCVLDMVPCRMPSEALNPTISS